MHPANASPLPTSAYFRTVLGTIALGGVAFCLLSVLPSSARATTLAPVVDQSIITSAEGAIAVFSGFSWGQSFTVGLSGSLTEIDFQLGRNAATTQPLQVELRTANGDLPNLNPSGLLFSGSITASDVPVLNFTSSFTASIDLSSAAPMVTSGEKLVVLLSSSDANWYNWDNSAYDNSNPYPNGTSIQLNSQNPVWTVVSNWDFGFRTWVAPVPEPSALIPLGLLVLGLRGIRKARSNRR